MATKDKPVDVYGQALMDYYEHQKPFDLKLHNSYGKPEKMPVEVFFREDHELNELEKLALEECRGEVLDIGAGTGVHSLILQDIGLEVTALDISQLAVELMDMSGVNNTICADILEMKDKSYDTLLMLMNGIGIAGKLNQLSLYLQKCSELLNENGQIILDSSDISYLYQSKPDDHYYGEIKYRYEYKKEKGPWFDWLYVDQKILIETCKTEGLTCDIIYEDDNDQYLARITHQD